MKPIAEGDKITHRALALSITVVVFLALLPVLFWGKLTQEVPLFYSLPWGENQITSKVMLFLPAAIASLFITINFVLSRTIYEEFKKEVFLRRILWVGTALSVLLGLVTTIRIILLFL